MNAAHPNGLLAKARMPNGEVQAVLADGSVQQFSGKRWAELDKAHVEAVQRIGASLARRQIDHQRRLAPIANLFVR